MSGKRRTLWRGSVLLGERGEEEEEVEELVVAITSHLPSSRGGEGFDWPARLGAAQLTRLPRAALRRPRELRGFLREGQLVEVIEYSGRLRRLLAGGHCALLEPGGGRAPVVVLLAQGEDMLAGFCPDWPSQEEVGERAELVAKFIELLEDNLAALPAGATTIPTRLPDSREVEEAKEAIVEEHLASLVVQQPLIKFGQNRFRYVQHADWRMEFHEQDIAYLAIFLEAGSKEVVVFASPATELAMAEEVEVTVEAGAAGEVRLVHPCLPAPLEVLLLQDLSTLEEHFLRLGRGPPPPAMLVEAATLQRLFASLETKHGSRVEVVARLQAEQPFVSCRIISEETRSRVEALVREGRGEQEQVQEQEEVQPCNPDEIIDGRPKWSKICQLRRSRVGGVEEEQVDDLAFDRLNPHRIFIPELDDNFENKNGEYQKVALKMLADLQVRTVVTLGDARLGEEVEARARREREEWEEFKVKYSYVAEERVEERAVQRKKTGGKVKSSKRSILAKTMRKIAS